MAFRYLFAHRQTNSRTGKFVSAVQPLIHDENPLEVLGVDSNSVVADGKYPFAIAVFPGGDLHVRRIDAAILNGVFDKILEQLD
jgi:hypothetical protein